MTFVNYQIYNKDIPEREIIDYACRGNVIRFYLGKNGNQWGDDWSDPYDNAGKVYNEYIGATVDLNVSYDYTVLCPNDTSYNYYSSYTKELMVRKCFPCIVCIPKELADYFYDLTFDKCQGCADAVKFYCGDDLSGWCNDALPKFDDEFAAAIISTEHDKGDREIIDFDIKGNLVHFFLGKNGTQPGADWEHDEYNEYAEPLRDEYIQATVDVFAPFGDVILEPADVPYGQRCLYSKQDMIERKVPCIMIVPCDVYDEYYCKYEFDTYSDNPKVKKYYFGDTIK